MLVLERVNEMTQVTITLTAEIKQWRSQYNIQLIRANRKIIKKAY